MKDLPDKFDQVLVKELFNVDLDELKKINELMATEVMGFEIVNNCETHTGEYWGKCGCGCPTNSLFMVKELGIYLDCYEPTTDMNQAMECADKYLTDHYSNIELEISRYACEKVWRVIIASEEIDEMDDSLPLAICKAILKAKGVKYE